MNERDDSEFFIGWQGKAPPATGRRLVRLTVALLGLVLAGAGVFAALQRTIGPAHWEYGDTQEFTGLLVAEPVPTLLTTPHEKSGASVFLLADPYKFGFDPAVAQRHHLAPVRLRGTVLHRDGRAMIEVTPGSVERASDLAARMTAPAGEDLGEHVLAGEIVDSKCFLGAMNPGQLKPHRACAIRCISGGVPPVLLVRDASGGAVYYVLVGPGGAAVNDAVLDYVAEPVEIRGRVRRFPEMLVLQADPRAIRRLP